MKNGENLQRQYIVISKDQKISWPPVRQREMVKVGMGRKTRHKYQEWKKMLLSQNSDINEIIGEHYKQIYVNKFDNLDDT